MVSASVTGLTPASFTLTNAAAAPQSILAVSGTPQTAIVNTAFGNALQAKVTDASSNPEANVTGTFTTPATGASAAFGGSPTVTPVTSAFGLATSGELPAIPHDALPILSASVTGLTPASFTLTNAAAAPQSILAVSGTPQTAIVNTAFGTALQAKVTDASSNPDRKSAV